MIFSVEILQTLVKLVQVKTLEFKTCKTTGAGILVKTALTSNEIKISSKFTEMFNFLDEICTIFNKR